MTRPRGEAAAAEIANLVAAQSGWQVLGHIESPIAGGDGNSEFLLAAQKDMTPLPAFRRLRRLPLQNLSADDYRAHKRDMVVKALARAGLGDVTVEEPLLVPEQTAPPRRVQVRQGRRAHVDGRLSRRQQPRHRRYARMPGADAGAVRR